MMGNAVNYLRTLKTNKGHVKWPTFQGHARRGYVDALIKREIQNMRNNASRRAKSSNVGGQRKVKDVQLVKKEED